MYKPEIHLSSADKKLIKLLANLLLQDAKKGTKTNIPDSFVALSDEEAKILIELINKVIKSERFQISSNFLEGLIPWGINEKGQKIFIKEKMRRGKSGAKASHQFAEFLLRLGIKPRDASGTFALKIPRLPKDRFLEMEKRLYEEVKIHPDVVKLLMTIVEKAYFRPNTNFNYRHLIKKPMKEVIKKLKPEEGLILKINVCAAITLIVNYSVLFTTRDWDATGTISSMTAVNMALLKKK